MANLARGLRRLALHHDIHLQVLCARRLLSATTRCAHELSQPGGVQGANLGGRLVLFCAHGLPRRLWLIHRAQRVVEAFYDSPRPCDDLVHHFGPRYLHGALEQQGFRGAFVTVPRTRADACYTFAIHPLRSYPVANYLMFAGGKEALHEGAGLRRVKVRAGTQVPVRRRGAIPRRILLSLVGNPLRDPVQSMELGGRVILFIFFDLHVWPNSAGLSGRCRAALYFRLLVNWYPPLWQRHRQAVQLHHSEVLAH